MSNRCADRLPPQEFVAVDINNNLIINTNKLHKTQ